MLRFCDKEIETVYDSELDRSQLITYFLNGHRYDPVCVVTETGEFYGIIRYADLLNGADMESAIDRSQVIADSNIWEAARKYFRQYEQKLDEIPVLPVLNKEHQLISFAYQDEDANRELRMLRELKECTDAVGFREVYPQIECVTIYDCNELAFRFAEYLKEEGVAVNVVGDMWQEVGVIGGGNMRS